MSSHETPRSQTQSTSRASRELLNSILKGQRRHWRPQNQPQRHTVQPSPGCSTGARPKSVIAVGRTRFELVLLGLRSADSAQILVTSQLCADVIHDEDEAYLGMLVSEITDDPWGINDSS